MHCTALHSTPASPETAWVWSPSLLSFISSCAWVNKLWMQQPFCCCRVQPHHMRCTALHRTSASTEATNLVGTWFLGFISSCAAQSANCHMQLPCQCIMKWIHFMMSALVPPGWPAADANAILMLWDTAMLHALHSPAQQISNLACSLVFAHKGSLAAVPVHQPALL